MRAGNQALTAPALARLAIASVACIGAASVASGCAVAPDLDARRAEFIEGFHKYRRLPLSVELEIEGDPRYGRPDQWETDIVLLFQDQGLGICTRAWAAGEPTAREAADMTVLVECRAVDATTAIEARGAWIDGLVWLLFPPATWWIRDVHFNPGVEIRVTSTPRGGEASSEELGTLAGLDTSLRNRHDLTSWATLGAVFLPSFIFKGADPERIEETLGERIRLEVGLRVAEKLLQKGFETRVLREREIHWWPGVLRLKPGPDLTHLRIFREEDGEGKPWLDPKVHRDDARNGNLLELELPGPYGGETIRVELVDGHEVSHYFTLRLEEAGQ